MYRQAIGIVINVNPFSKHVQVGGFGLVERKR
jgi:hypothetical protein